MQEQENYFTKPYPYELCLVNKQRESSEEKSVCYDTVENIELLHKDNLPCKSLGVGMSAVMDAMRSQVWFQGQFETKETS